VPSAATRCTLSSPPPLRLAVSRFTLHAIPYLDLLEISLQKWNWLFSPRFTTYETDNISAIHWSILSCSEIMATDGRASTSAATSIPAWRERLHGANDLAARLNAAVDQANALVGQYDAAEMEARAQHSTSSQKCVEQLAETNKRIAVRATKMKELSRLYQVEKEKQTKTLEEREVLEEKKKDLDGLYLEACQARERSLLEKLGPFESLSVRESACFCLSLDRIS
jgi:hypothetical protein